jgi:hypothetical protein
MRTLSPRADAERQRAVTSWWPLLTLTLWRDRYGAAPASLTLYASDVTRYLPVDGVTDPREYLGLVLTWGTLGDSLEALNPATAPASVDLLLSNQVPVAAGGLSVARFTDLLREGTQTEGYDPGGADCAIAWLPPGGTIGLDDVILYVGRLDTIDPADEATVHLKSTSGEAGATIPILDAAVETGQVPAPIGDGGTLNGLLDGFEEPSLAMWTVSTMSTSTDVRPGAVTGGHCAQTTGTLGTAGYALRLGFSPSETMRGRLYARIVSRTTGASFSLHSPVLGFYDSGGGTGVHGMGFYHVQTGDRFYANIGNTTVYGTQPVTVGTWYRFEARFTGVTTDPATVVVTIYAGDATTPIETITASAARPTVPAIVRIGTSISSTNVTELTLAFDDLVLTAIDEEIGPGGIWLAVPSADVQYEMTRSTGSTNYSCVDDWPGAVDDASSYVTAMSPLMDRYRITFPGGAPSAGRRLRYSQMMLRATSLSGDPTVTVQPVVGTNTGELYRGSLTNVLQVYDWIPAGGYGAFFKWADVAAITVSNFTIGVQRTNVSSGTLRVTLVAINLDFH